MKVIILTILTLMMMACSPVMATGASDTQTMTNTAVVAFMFTIMAFCYVSLAAFFHLLAHITGMRKP